MGYKMLLADDSITIQKVVSIIFANEDNKDYELTVVDNGTAALEKAREILPDILLVDALMPGKTGYEVCREARQDPALKNIPLLLLVGAFEPFDEEKARNSGADDHISKPFESQHLIEKVKKLIEIGKERIAASSPLIMPTEAAPAKETTLISDNEDVISGIGSGAFEIQADAFATAIKKPVEPVLLSSEDIVEASPEDDLWGVFELEEVAEGEDIQLGEILEEDEFQPTIIDTAEEIEPFVFDEEEETSIIEEDVHVDLNLPSDKDEPDVFHEEPEREEFDRFDSARFEAMAEDETFMLSDDESVNVISELTSSPAAAEKDEVPSASTDVPSSRLSFVPSEPIRHFVMDAAETKLSADVVSPVSEPLTGQAFEADEIQLKEEQPADVIHAPACDTVMPDVAEPVAAGEIHLSEAQLASVIARVSKEMIEKIAWEVVPDLAEAIIKEEIRKIKQGH